MEINGEAFEYDTHIYIIYIGNIIYNTSCVTHVYIMVQVIVHDHKKYYGITRELKKTKPLLF